MKKLKEIGSCFSFLIIYFLLPKEVNLEFQISLIILFISSLLYHYNQIKTNKIYLNNNVYIKDKNKKILLYFDKFSINYIFLISSGILNNYHIIFKIFLCLFVCYNERYSNFLTISSIFFTLPYLVLMKFHNSFILLLLTFLLIFIQIKIEFFIIPIKYIWHIICSLICYYGGIITILQKNKKTELYNQTNMIVKIVYFALVINFIIYKNTLTDINKNDNNK